MFLADVPVPMTDALRWFVGQSVPNIGDGSGNEKLRAALMASDWQAVRSAVIGEDLQRFDFAAEKWTMINGRKVYFPFSLSDIKRATIVFSDIINGPDNRESPESRLQMLRQKHYRNALGMSEAGITRLETSGQAKDLAKRDRLEAEAALRDWPQRLARTIPYAPAYLARRFEQHKTSLVEGIAGAMVIAGGLYAGGAAINAASGAISGAITGAGGGTFNAAQVGQAVSSIAKSKATDYLQGKAMEFAGSRIAAPMVQRAAFGMAEGRALEQELQRLTAQPAGAIPPMATALPDTPVALPIAAPPAANVTSADWLPYAVLGLIVLAALRK